MTMKLVNLRVLPDVPLTCALAEVIYEVINVTISNEQLGFSYIL